MQQPVFVTCCNKLYKIILFKSSTNCDLIIYWNLNTNFVW